MSQQFTPLLPLRRLNLFNKRSSDRQMKKPLFKYIAFPRKTIPGNLRL